MSDHERPVLDAQVMERFQLLAEVAARVGGEVDGRAVIGNGSTQMVAILVEGDPLHCAILIGVERDPRRRAHDLERQV